MSYKRANSSAVIVIQTDSTLCVYPLFSTPIIIDCSGSKLIQHIAHSSANYIIDFSTGDSDIFPDPDNFNPIIRANNFHISSKGLIAAHYCPVPRISYINWIYCYDFATKSWYLKKKYLAKTVRNVQLLSDGKCAITIERDKVLDFLIYDLWNDKEQIFSDAKFDQMENLSHLYCFPFPKGYFGIFETSIASNDSIYFILDSDTGKIAYSTIQKLLDVYELNNIVLLFGSNGHKSYIYILDKQDPTIGCYISPLPDELSQIISRLRHNFRSYYILSSNCYIQNFPINNKLSVVEQFSYGTLTYQLEIYPHKLGYYKSYAIVPNYGHTIKISGATSENLEFLEGITCRLI